MLTMCVCVCVECFVQALTDVAWSDLMKIKNTVPKRKRRAADDMPVFLLRSVRLASAYDTGASITTTLGYGGTQTTNVFTSTEHTTTQSIFLMIPT